MLRLLIPHAAMNASVSSIRDERSAHRPANGDRAAKSRFQRCTWCKSAYPPLANARSRFSVPADWKYPVSIREGSGVRSAAVNSGPLMMSPR